mmetsp:Transcript_68316/g.193547  ORF Transcript_68316/g.193547 Transcript_68316/m.193547 type:complete len:342 (-) Transcript_68316:429-1454(-)
MAKTAAMRQNIIQDIWEPLWRTDFSSVSVCLAMTPRASGAFSLDCFSLTSATFFTTASSFWLCVAPSLTSSRLRPMISCLISSTPALCAWPGLPLLPMMRCAALSVCLQSSPSLSTRSSSVFSSSKSCRSAGAVVLMCVPRISTRRPMWSVWDFWSRKCLCSSVSMSRSVSWICVDTSLFSSPMEVSSKLLTSTCATETRSANAPSVVVPLQAVRPMKPPALMGCLLRSIAKHSCQLRLGDCFSQPSTEVGRTRIFSCAAFSVFLKSMALASSAGTSWYQESVVWPSLVTPETSGLGLFSLSAIDSTTPMPSKTAFMPPSVRPCSCMPFAQLSALMFWVSL